MPVSGASSTEPLTSTISPWRPVSSRWRAAIRGYFVATRMTPRRRSDSTRRVGAGLARHHHRAAPEAEVEQLVDVAAALARRVRELLEQHVLAGHAEVGGAGLDVRGHVGRAHRDHADVLEQQLAVVRAQLIGVEPERREQLDGAVEQGAARDGDRQAVRRRSRQRSARAVARSRAEQQRPVPRSSPASAWCSWSTSSAKPTAGSWRPKRPSSSS